MVYPSSDAVAPRERTWYHPARLIRRTAPFLLGLYSLPGTYLYAIQTSLIYDPVPVSVAEAIKQAKAVNLVMWDHPTSTLPGPQGYVRPDFASPASRGTIVFFHGNGDPTEPAWATATRRSRSSIPTNPSSPFF
jgi:hypothetical protein